MEISKATKQYPVSSEYYLDNFYLEVVVGHTGVVHVEIHVRQEYIFLETQFKSPQLFSSQMADETQTFSCWNLGQC